VNPSGDSLEELRRFLHENVRREFAEWFGVPDGTWVKRAVDNWFNDEKNYDNRWRVILARRPKVGKILDMAAGCGTFMLYGLRQGHDVIGVEPEAWKREYFRRKLKLSTLPIDHDHRMIGAFGEALPFADETFDLVTTFQTLEHVRDVDACLAELVRVLKPGGVLYCRAPDYNCFFEPHYRLPFLPTMRRDWAEAYLRRVGRPVAGLHSLNWTTERQMISALRSLPADLHIDRTREFFIEARRQQVASQLSPLARKLGGARILNEAHQLRRQATAWIRGLRQERVIDLWITKRAYTNRSLRRAA
jgi:ubiquinone/menaquinone biosynthesis C-methylase UbiE